METITAGKLEIRPAEYLAFADGQPLKLTVRELQLLTALARRADRIVTREELHEAVWGGSYTKADRSVDVYVGKLRQKLEQVSPGCSFIHTHFGFGYRLASTPEASSHPFYRSATDR
ncbi:MAG TPA: winged helix-turn-helix domain-containing protein [Thermoleophilaceae bacterium]|nr:winged helix-turn-helix domain-containing protein [Thermoleophilaceae bacterium]